MKKFIFLMLSILILGLPLTVSASEADGLDISGQIDWNNGVIQATGLGFAPFNAINPSQGVAMARRAAVMDAYRNLLETVKGMRIDADTTVSNLQVSDTIRSKVSGVIRGAHVVSEQPSGDGGYKVTVEIKMYGDNSVAAAVLGNQGPAIPLPEPTKLAPSTQTYAPAMPDYTGIVIDARGLGLERVMSPAVYDDKGRAIYGTRNLDSTFVVKYGMADYITNDEISEVGSGKSRAGNNPLIIKAVAVKDFNANIVISEDDANKILIANKQTGFLTKAAVVFEQ